MSLRQRFDHALAAIFQDQQPTAIGVAVSGGGDSMALLELSRGWAAGRGITVRAATVNHGLRPEAAFEAASVAQFCAALGLAHETLPWQGWDGRGNLQSAARTARQGLLADWAQRHDLDDLLLGHTADDQAETVAMRLLRGSGVDGLCGMEVVSVGPGSKRVTVLRPLLSFRRQELRDFLRAEGIGWAEDTSNDDLRFDRVRARRLLADWPVPAERLLRTADHMARARQTLQRAAADLARAEVTEDRGDLLLSPEVLHLGAEDSPGRVLSGALRWVGGGDYRPDWDALMAAAARLAKGETITLAGVLARPDPALSPMVRLSREVARVAPRRDIAHAQTTAARWDRGWLVSRRSDAPFGAGLALGAMGEAGLRACPDWRATGLPRETLLAAPAVWRGDALVSAPLARPDGEWMARIAPDFVSFLKGD